MYTENREESSFKPVFYLLIITLIVIIIYFFLTKSNFILKQATNSTTDIETDNNANGLSDQLEYLAGENKILIASDDGSVKELAIGDIILIQTQLGDTITAEEIAMEAIEFKHWASNDCLSGQIPKYNGMSWICAEDESLGLFEPTITPTGSQLDPTASPLPGTTIYPTTTPLPGESRLSISVNGTDVKTVFLNYDGVPISEANFQDLNSYLTGVSFNTATGDLTFARNELGTITVDLDGRYITASSVNVLTNKTFNITENEINGEPLRVPVFNSAGRMISSNIIADELGFLTGTDSNIQDQLDLKVPNLREILTTLPLRGGGDLTNNLTLSIDQASNASDGYITASDYLDFSEVNWEEIVNNLDSYLDYRPNDIQCADDDILIYNSVTPGWLCASFSTGGLLASLTNGNGITTFSYDGSNSTTVALGPLTSNWVQSGSYDIVSGVGTFNNTSAAADLYIAGNIENDGTLYTNNLVASGNIAFNNANSFRLRESTNEATTSCAFSGELILDTSENKIFTCLTPGTPGSWMDVAYAAANSGPSQIVLTTNSFDGNFTFTGGYVGYQAANMICNAQLNGSHMCQSSEIISYINNSNIGSLDGSNAWVAEGAPGYTANANDCSGWTNNSTTYLGAFWYFIAGGGGNGSLINCSQLKPIACCK
ncbi:MAG TPA: hypothetical protein PKU95_02095 [Candidatus Dojkabacteria bacterium]|nr:hypothetical protein [Candidatus Dojkabacteria bacterium]